MSSSAGGAVADVTATLGEGPIGADSERSGGEGGTTPGVIGKADDAAPLGKCPNAAAY